MKRFAINTAKRVGKALLYGVAGGSVVLVILLVKGLNNRPDLKVWHTAELDAEFTASSPVRTFAEYLALEDRLFKQLNEEVYDRIDEEDQRILNRFHRGSLADPERWSPNWNRSFELPAQTPAPGVLLLHGMSDSPYSLRAIGERLHADGAWVLGLRVPGHGTAPSALTRVTWQDMAAAVRLAMHHLREQTGDQPLYIVGYSNGAALAVHYALTTLDDPSLPPLDGLVLLSPEIGVTRLAALAIWQERLGRILGLRKLAWNDILPEYDPFKYSSFPVNAGNLVYLITGENRARLTKLAAAGKLGRFPPVLAFQSAVDATVRAPALVRDLFERLPDRDHELVVLDLNRSVEIKALLKSDPAAGITSILKKPNRTFTVSLLTNESKTSPRVVIHTRRPGRHTDSTSPTGLAWPIDVYSLTHVALPFPENDPVYGGDPDPGPGIQIGMLAPRGERGVLQVPAAALLRLRWNPFYPYLEQRIRDRLKLSPQPEPPDS